MIRTLVRSSARLSILAALLVPVACNAEDFMLARTVHNLEKMQSYHGTLAEEGVLPGETMVSELWYKRPGKFLSKVLSPSAYAGVTMAYTGSQLVLYYPNAGYAIRFENLLVPGPDDERKLISDAYRHNTDHFRFDFTGGDKIAGLTTIGMRYRARLNDWFVPGGTTQVYDKYSFSIAGTTLFYGAARYAWQFKDIAFNQIISDDKFDLQLPKNVVLSRWDMASTPLTDKDVREQANFEVSQLPAPAGLPRERIIREAGPVPAFTEIFRSGPHFLFHTMYRDTGLRPTPVEHGVPVTSPTGGRRGHLLVTPTLSYFGYTHKGTRHILIGNIPVEDLVAQADRIP
jgi:outer membrane lipoprotein-sorting protein